MVWRWTPGGAFGEVTGIAFDNWSSASDPAAGDLYVLESEPVPAPGSEALSSAVDLFKPEPNPAGDEAGGEGTFVGRLEKQAQKLEAPNAIAVDSATGRVLVADASEGAIDTFSDTGVFEEALKGKGSPHGSFQGREEAEESVEGLAVEETSGDIYVGEADYHAVSQYSPSGEWLGWVTTAAAGGALVEPHGVAPSGSGEVFVGDPGASVVNRFGPNVVVASVETGKAAKAGIARTSALLKATIDGEGKPCTYRFQYGESETLGLQNAPSSCGPASEEASGTIEGLRANRVYYYRAVAEDEDGTNYGLIRSFETPPAVEGVSTGPVTAWPLKARR